LLKNVSTRRPTGWLSHHESTRLLKAATAPKISGGKTNLLRAMETLENAVSLPTAVKDE
jgi:hypothetical protein